jgi:WD40 repeat protein
LDKEKVRVISDLLRNRGINTWLDEEQLQPGKPWQELIGEEIKKSKAAAVFVGKNGIGPWQKQEIFSFLKELVERGCAVIPVILSDAPSNTESLELPPFLLNVTWVDFRKKIPDPLEALCYGITGSRNKIEQETKNKPVRISANQKKYLCISTPAILSLIYCVYVAYSLPKLDLISTLDAKSNTISLKVLKSISPNNQLEIVTSSGSTPAKIWTKNKNETDDKWKLRINLPDESQNSLSISVNESRNLIATTHGNFQDNDQSNDSKVRIWSLKTGALLRVLGGHTKQVRAVTFSPSGKELATGSLDKTLRIWSSIDGKLLHKIQAHEDVVTSVVFSPNGKYIATASDDKTIKIWDAYTLREKTVLKGHEGSVLSVFSSTIQL